MEDRTVPCYHPSPFAAEVPPKFPSAAQAQQFWCFQLPRHSAQ